MSEKIIEQYGRVTIYTEPNHPSPIYHVDGSIDPNPYGDLAVLLEDDNLEEVMYNGGTQCVKIAKNAIARMKQRARTTSDQPAGARLLPKGRDL